MTFTFPALPSARIAGWVRRVAQATALSLAPACVAAALPATAAAQDRENWLDIEVGKSVVIETPRNATAIAITDPNVADIIPLASANKIQVQGKAVGSTDLVIQQGAGIPPLIYEITVHQDLSDLVRRVDAIVEGEPPLVYPLKERIVVQGAVDDLDTLERVAQVAEIYDEDFINLMTVRGDHQVQLEVVFAEVSRSSLRELGLNVLFGDDAIGLGLVGPIQNSTVLATNPDLAGAIGGTLGQGVATAAGAGGFSVPFVLGDVPLAGVMSILDSHTLGKLLAQPTLTCLSGQQCEFLAGGEIPMPGPGGQGVIQIVYKEYGVKLAFVPTVLAGNVVDMRINLEVSEPDFGNSVRLTGIEIPGFVSRKGKSHLRVESGMTFALAGLLSENIQYSRVEVPGLGRIPVIGTLFRYTRHNRRESELMIFVTPRLVRPLGAGEVPAAPGTTENNDPTDLELFLLGMERRPGSQTAERTTAPSGSVGLQR